MHINLKGQLAVIAIIIFAGVCETKAVEMVQFGPAMSFSAGAIPGQLVISDFNLDGKPDVAAAKIGGVNVLLGQGDGRMGPPITNNFSTGGFSKIAFGDFNGDGNRDLAEADWYSTRIFLGNGGGSFTLLTNLSTLAVYPSSVAVSDLDGNGKDDLVVVNTGNPSWRGVAMGLGNGNGSFASPTNHSITNIPTEVRVGDLDGDGKVDMVFSLSNSGWSTSNSIAVITNKGGGVFGGPRYLADQNGIGGVGMVHASLVMEDFNRDGRLDVAVLNNTVSNTVTIWINNGGINLVPTRYYSSKFGAVGIVAADFNCDGLIDMVIRGSGGYLFLMGCGDGSFIAEASIQDSFGNNLAAGDFNSDGLPDLAVAGTNSTVAILLNQTAPTLRLSPMPSYHQVTWNACLGNGYTLQVSTDITSQQSWQSFPQPPILIGNLKGVADWTIGEQRFYRLIKP